MPQLPRLSNSGLCPKMDAMPLLIDGNNLMFALAEVGVDAGRSAVCRLVADLAAGGAGAAPASRRAHVVFDGPPPQGTLTEQIEDTRIEVTYSGTRKADAILIELIAADSAPRRLTVVSTDHEIRQAAHRRRCTSMTSADFARVLVREVLHRPSGPAGAGEPPEKRSGLTPEQVDQWLRDLGLESSEEAD